MMKWTAFLIAIGLCALTPTASAQGGKAARLMLSIDGDSMTNPAGPGGAGTGASLANDLKNLLTGWNVRDHSVSGSVIANLVSRESVVDRDYSKSNSRNELLIWVGI